jgi:hypothetical protein
VMRNQKPGGVPEDDAMERDSRSGWQRKGALSPLLRGAPLSKNAVSRLAARLREDFEAWAQRDFGALKNRRGRRPKKRLPDTRLVLIGDRFWYLPLRKRRPGGWRASSSA